MSPVATWTTPPLGYNDSVLLASPGTCTAYLLGPGLHGTEGSGKLCSSPAPATSPGAEAKPQLSAATSMAYTQKGDAACRACSIFSAGRRPQCAPTKGGSQA
mmetsp:Transcript_124314/g.247841  ORF Transcript_124314/g.247841 Transcript_124314/m.247841 type:complete len:102 (-) Transcript_124314:18-323(-)